VAKGDLNPPAEGDPFTDTDRLYLAMYRYAKESVEAGGGGQWTPEGEEIENEAVTEAAIIMRVAEAINLLAFGARA
jgi:hypothetical protein